MSDNIDQYRTPVQHFHYFMQALYKKGKNGNIIKKRKLCIVTVAYIFPHSINPAIARLVGNSHNRRFQRYGAIYLPGVILDQF